MTTVLAGLLVLAFCGLLVLEDPNWFWQDDYQTLHLPAFMDMSRALKAGELPLVSPYAWSGGALAGELPQGVFSVFLLLCHVTIFSLGLPLGLAAALLSATHLAILASGVYRLARHRDLPRDLSLLAALVTTLSGYLMLWGARNWLPVLGSFAWLPWLWLGMEMALARPHRPGWIVLAGVFLYLLITAGWPFTIVMAAILSGWLTLRVWCQGRRLLATWPIFVVWAVGVGLAAPAWLVFLDYLKDTYRGQTPLLARSWVLVVPYRSLPALVFPSLITTWTFFHGPLQHMSLELSGGLAPAGVLAAALLCRPGRAALWRYRWEAALGLLLLFMACFPGLGNFRWSFRWLPLFFLLLSLVGAHVLHELRRGKEGRQGTSLRGNAGLAACILVALVGGWAWLSGQDPTPRTAAHAVTLTLLCAAWAVTEGLRRVGGRWQAWTPVVVVLVSSWLGYRDIERWTPVGHWEGLRDAHLQSVYTPGIRYLSFHLHGELWRPHPNPQVPKGVGAGAQLLPGNATMYAGVERINGYSSIEPRSVLDMFPMNYIGALEGKGMTGTTPHLLLTRESGPGGLLELAGTDGIVLTPALAGYGPALLANGWHLERAFEHGKLYHRDTPSPRAARVIPRAMVVGRRRDAIRHVQARTGPQDPWCLLCRAGGGPRLVEFGGADLEVLRTGRCVVEVEVNNPDPGREALVVFPRPGYPGYRAWLNGRSLPVDQMALGLPAVRIPPGARGRLVLRYLPSSLVLGSGLALVTLLGCLATLWLARARRPAAGVIPTAPCATKKAA